MAKKPRKSVRTASFREPMSDEQIARQALRERSKGRAHLWRNIIIVFIVTAALSLVISLRSSSLIQDVAQVVNETIAAKDEDPGREEAIRAVNKWLTSDSSPFPDGVSNLQWVDADHVGDADNGSDVEQLWSHRFTFTELRTGETRVVAQLVSVNGDTASASGVPSILPGSPSDDSGSTSSAPDGYPTLDQSNSLSTAIQQWSRAYIGSDSDSLTVLVADPNGDHGYQSAGLGSYANSTVNWAVWTADPSDSDADPSEDSGWGAVSVTISFVPIREDEDADGPKNNASTTLTLLVSDPTSGSAKVVDWGADCDLKSLHPYSHALARTDVTNGDGDEDDASATTDETMTGGDEEPADTDGE